MTNYGHVDHRNTPRLVADATGTTVWRWDQTEPFGNNPADENPSGLGLFYLPLRPPGQYFDKETNLHYNYFRDYDPSLGRYSESDPIGLRGGLNDVTDYPAAGIVAWRFRDERGRDLTAKKSPRVLRSDYIREGSKRYGEIVELQTLREDDPERIEVTAHVKKCRGLECDHLIARENEMSYVVKLCVVRLRP